MAKTEKIFSKNAAYQRFEVLKTNRNKRYKYGEFFVEGVRNLNEAVRGGWTISSLLYTRENPLSQWAQDMIRNVKTQVNYELTAPLMADLSGKTDTSELMAVVRMREDRPESLKLSDCPLIALFDRPSNHGNLGTVLRSCDGLGVEALLITGHAVDLYDPEVVGASMGSLFSVPAIRMQGPEDALQYVASLREKHPDFQIVGTTAHRQSPLMEVDMTRPTMIVIGNETEGMCRAFKESCDVLTTIPMADTSSASSFNVACAATVLFYEAVRQRRTK